MPYNRQIIVINHTIYATDETRTDKIGLAIIDNSNEPVFKLERIGKQSCLIRDGIENNFLYHNDNQKYPFIAIYEYNYFTSIYDFVSNIVGHELKSPFEIPYISEDNIEDSIVSTFNFKN
jgi:hypothetical protein